jgi:hypothetical protein
MSTILVTLAVFHLLISWSKAEAMRNVPDRSTTADVFHLLMSPLKPVFSLKRPIMLVTVLVSQSAM